MDTQSAKTAEGGAERGTDGGKNVKGRKRHILVGTMGLLIAVAVTAANVDDGRAAPLVLGQAPPEEFPRLLVVYGDSKYHIHGLQRWMAERRVRYRVAVVGRPSGAEGFNPLPVRWAVERTSRPDGRYRCLSKDYENTPRSSEAVVGLAAVRHLLRRLRPARRSRSERFRSKPKPPKRAAWDFWNRFSRRRLFVPINSQHPCKISPHPCRRPGALIAVPRTPG